MMARYRMLHGRIVRYEPLMPDGVDRLIGAIAGIVKKFLFFGKQEKRAAKIGSYYHYTSAGSLEGMLKSGEFWLSEVASTNDKTEVRHGYEAFFSLLEEKRLRYEHAGKELEVKVCETIEGRLRPVLTVEKSLGYFVGSLTTKDDDLTQWGRYGDSDAGVQIKFNLKGFEGDKVLGIRLNYSERELLKYQKNILEVAIRFVRRIYLLYPVSKGEHKRLHINVFGKIANAILSNAIASKQSSFVSESELRLIKITKPRSRKGILRRNRGGKVVRYVVMKLDLGKAIEGVKMGPKASTSDRRKVEEMLKRAGLSNLKVEESAIPYRYNVA